MTDVSIHTPVQTLVVIPCLNEEAHLEKLIDTLLKSCDAVTTRIVIADGRSTDRTPQIAQELAQNHAQILYMHNPKRLQAAALNLAAATYGQEATYLLRIDAHADYPVDYCRVLQDEALRTKADAVVVAMNTVGKTPFQKAVAAAQNSKLGNGGSAHRKTGATGCWVNHGHHALMRMEAFRAVGGYDESFAHNEDAELDFRLTQAGYKIWLTAKTSLVYYPRSTAQALFRQYAGYGFGRACTILKHKMRPKMRQLLPVCVLPALLLAVLTPLFAFACAPLLLWLALCLIYGLGLAYSAQNRELALAGPAAAIMHAGWSLGFWKALLSAKTGKL